MSNRPACPGTLRRPNSPTIWAVLRRRKSKGQRSTTSWRTNLAPCRPCTQDADRRPKPHTDLRSQPGIQSSCHRSSPLLCQGSCRSRCTGKRSCQLLEPPWSMCPSRRKWSTSSAAASSGTWPSADRRTFWVTPASCNSSDLRSTISGRTNLAICCRCTQGGIPCPKLHNCHQGQRDTSPFRHRCWQPSCLRCHRILCTGMSRCRTYRRPPRTSCCA